MPRVICQGAWACPEDPKGKCGLENMRRAGSWLAHSHSTDPRRGRSIALRLCSLLSKRLTALSHRSTVKVKCMLVGEGSVHSLGPHLPSLHGSFLQNGPLRPGSHEPLRQVSGPSSQAGESEHESTVGQCIQTLD